MEYALNIKGRPSELAAILLLATETEEGCEAAEPAAEPVKPYILGVTETPEMMGMGGKDTDVPAKAEKPKPEEARKVPTFEEIRNAAMAAINAGKRDGLSAVLKEFGVDRVTNLAETDRAAFLEKVKEL